MSGKGSIQLRILNNLAKVAGYKSLLQLTKDNKDINYSYFLQVARGNKLLEMNNSSIEKLAKCLRMTPLELRESVKMQSQAEAELGSGMFQIDSSEVPLLLSLRLLKKRAPVAHESVVNLIFHLTSNDYTDETPKQNGSS